LSKEFLSSYRVMRGTLSARKSPKKGWFGQKKNKRKWILEVDHCTNKAGGGKKQKRDKSPPAGLGKGLQQRKGGNRTKPNDSARGKHVVTESETRQKASGYPTNIGREVAVP